MATELAKAYVQIVPSAQGIKGSITSALGGEADSAGAATGQSFGGKMIGALKGIITVAAIGKALAASITEGAALEQSLGGVETLFKDNAEAVKQAAAQAYRTAGMSANEYMETVTGFSASLLQSLSGDTAKAAQTADMALTDMSDNANKMGTSMEDIKNAYQGFAKQNYTMLDNLKLGYGGTKTEMQRLLADAQKLTGVEYDISSLDDVYNAIHAIQGEMGITGTTALEAATTITGSMAAMKASFKDVLANLALGRDIGPSLNALADTTSTFLFKNLLPAVGNILKGLGPALLTFIQAAVPQLVDGLMEFIPQLQSAFVTGIPQLMQMATDLLNQFSGGIASGYPMLLQNGMEMLSQLVSGIAANLPALFQAALTTIVSFVMGIIANAPQIIESGKNLLLNVVSGIQQSLPQMLTAATDAIGAVVMGIITNLPQLLSAGFRLIGTLISSIGSTVSMLVESGKTILTNILSGLIQALPQIVETAFQLISELIVGIIVALPQLIAAGMQILASLVSGISQSQKQLLTAAVSMIQSLVTGIIENLPQIMAAGITMVTQMITGIAQSLPQIISSGIQLVGSLISGLLTAIPNILSAAGDIVKAIWDAIKNTDWLELGKDIIRGLINGIGAMAGALWDAAVNIAKSALDAIKSFFGIKSPSRVMRDEVGKMIPAGIAAGIEGNTKPVTDAMRALSERTVGAIQPELAFRLSANQTAAGSAGAGVAAPGGVTYHTEIYSHDSLSEAELSQEILNAAERSRWKTP